MERYPLDWLKPHIVARDARNLATYGTTNCAAVVRALTAVGSHDTAEESVSAARALIAKAQGVVP